MKYINTYVNLVMILDFDKTSITILSCVLIPSPHYNPNHQNKTTINAVQLVFT